MEKKQKEIIKEGEDLESQIEENENLIEALI